MRCKVCLTAVIVSIVAAGNAGATDAVASEAPAGNICELERIRVISQGDGVSAEFSSVDTSTCAMGIETAVHVEASQGVVTKADHCGPGGNPMGKASTSQSNVVAVFVSVYDRCASAQVLAVTGTGEADELHLNPNMKTASLRAGFLGVDAQDQPVSIALDLVWNGVGQREHTGDHIVSNGRTIFRFLYSSSGTIRDAVASGSVVIGETDTTPLSSSEGTIERNASHVLEVYR